MPRRLRDFSASMSCLMELPCRQVCMNCLAPLRLKSSRVDLALPISRMPRDLFQMVLERVRVGTWREMSRPRKAEELTSSAISTILPRVALSRCLMRLLRVAVDDFFFAIKSPLSGCPMQLHYAF